VRLPAAAPARASLRRRRPGVRRWLSAGLVAAAAAVGLRVLAPVPPRLVPLVVAAHDIPAGHRLAASDVRVAEWLRGTGPGRAMAQVGGAVGRVSAGPLAAGSAVTDADLLGPGLLTGQPPGLLAVPVRVAESAAAGLVQPGDRVDVIAVAGSGGSAGSAGSAGSGSSGSGGGSGAVVTGVVVLAEPAAGATGGDSGGLPGGFAGGAGAVAGSTLDGTVIVVGVPLGDAERLARAQANGQLSLAVHPR
jgi:pilus assembly protein CpaB